MKPVNVNKKNIFQMWRNQYKYPDNNNIKIKFNIGDFVQISKMKKQFEKGNESNYSEEIFKVTKILKRNPPVYGLVDLNNEKNNGTFYTEELVKVSFKPDNRFKIRKIIETRGRGTQKKITC